MVRFAINTQVSGVDSEMRGEVMRKLRFFMAALRMVTIVISIYACTACVRSDKENKSNEFSRENKSDILPIRLGAYRLQVPKMYLATGVFSVQTTDHLVLDVQLPDVRPLNEEEINERAKTGLMSPDTAHIILEAGDNYLYGDRLFEIKTIDQRYSIPGYPPYKYLPAEISGVPGLLVYHNQVMERDVYLINGTSPKFFFDCDSLNVLLKNPDCKYFGHLVGNIRYQIWYDRSRYFRRIEELTPKIDALLKSFIVDRN